VDSLRLPGGLEKGEKGENDENTGQHRERCCHPNSLVLMFSPFSPFSHFSNLKRPARKTRPASGAIGRYSWYPLIITPSGRRD
jgi:hypothetical protein